MRQTSTPESLFLRRLAARAIESVLDGLQVRQLAIVCDADDPRVMRPHPDGSYRWARDWYAKDAGEGLARVHLNVTSWHARVVVPKLDALIRPPHRSEFDARAVGIVRDGRENDIDTEIDLTEIVAEEGELMLGAPQKESKLATPGRPRRMYGVKHCRSKVGREQ